MFAGAILNIQNVYAQDPITFIDENGEKVQYGEQKEWTRTIHFTFSDDPAGNYDIYQTTSGNEVWITNTSGGTEYHIGNNGECGWPAVNVPYVDGYVQTHLQVPEVDLYWHPEMVYENEVTVSYARVGEWSPEMEEITPPHSTTEPYKAPETPLPQKSETAEIVETKEPEITSAPVITTEPSEITETQSQEKSKTDWVVPGALAITCGIGAAAYFAVKKLNLTGDDDE